MTDPIADMLTRIRNGLAVRKPEVSIPYSKIKFTIAGILEKSGYLKKVEKVEQGAGHDAILVALKYLGKEPAISNLKRISTPGHRVYAPKDKLPVVLNNLGIAVISTSQGVMTNKQAKKKNLGGEVLCEIY